MLFSVLGCIYLGHAKALLMWMKHVSQGFFNSFSSVATRSCDAGKRGAIKKNAVTPVLLAPTSQSGSCRVLTRSFNKSGSRDRYWFVMRVMFSAEINKGVWGNLGTICEPITGTTSICAGSHSVLIWQLHGSWSRTREERGFWFSWWLTNIVGGSSPPQLWQIKHLNTDIKIAMYYHLS